MESPDFLSGFQGCSDWLLCHCWGQDFFLGLEGQPPETRTQNSQEQVLGKVVGSSSLVRLEEDWGVSSRSPGDVRAALFSGRGWRAVVHHPPFHITLKVTGDASGPSPSPPATGTLPGPPPTGTIRPGQPPAPPPLALFLQRHTGALK